MKTLLSAIVLLGMAQPAYAYFDALDGLLSEHTKIVTKNNVSYNGVDYDAWADDARHAVVRDEILGTNPESLGTKEERLAYWINAYNVLSIDLIVREGERESIKNLGSLFVSPWKSHSWEIGGKAYTLDDIEHGVIRPLGEARIHFAVNCAAKSCPDLRSEAYRPEVLWMQLADQTRLTFGNSSKGYKKLPDQNAVRVSKVMDWFDEDFNGGDLRGWLKPYFPDVINDETTVRFFSYDWSLNKQ